jgi:2-dehydropantoate 2-reductase
MASMYQDLIRGNRLELPWLSGGVVKFGRELGIPVPCNRAIADIFALYVDGAKDR